MVPFQKLSRVLSIFLVMLMLLGIHVPQAFAQAAFDEISVYCNNEKVEFSALPVIENGRTLVPLRPVLEAMGCTVTWNGYNRTIKVQSGSTIVLLAVDETEMEVKKNSGTYQEELDVAPQIMGGSTFLPIRAVVEAFGAVVQWNGDAQRIDITYKKKPNVKPTAEPTEEPIPAPTSVPTEQPDFDIMDTETEEPTEQPAGGRIQNGHTFYYQSEPAWEFENNGSGYCWVCAYAMLLNDVVGDVTPADVAKVNESMETSGAYCHHWMIVAEFGATFAPAISEESPYFDSYDEGKGATYILNPERSEEVAIAAIKEALDNHPAGVLVRFETYPHTIVAVGYEEDTIYFHDPMNEQGGYDTEDLDGKIPFECTYNGHKGMTLAEASFLQAIIVNE